MLLLILILLTLLLGMGGLYVVEKISLPSATPDLPGASYRPLEENFTVGDVESMRFSAVSRGYRMSEVDEVVGQLQERIRQQEEEIAQLKLDSSDTQQV